MSQRIELQAYERSTGTAASRNLRRQKRVPAIIYGGDSAPQPVSLSLFELQRRMQEDAFYSSILQLNTPRGEERAVLKALDQHPIRNEPIHLDFMRVSASTRVTMTIPLSFINEEECVGVKTSGGIITYQLTQATISARADAIPERLEVDMAGVELSQAVPLSSVPLPSGVTIPILEQGQDPAVAVVLPPKISKEDLQADAEAEAEAAEGAEDQAPSEDAADSDEDSAS